MAYDFGTWSPCPKRQTSSLSLPLSLYYLENKCKKKKKPEEEKKEEGK
jgi:hypothetical protein